MARTSVSVVLAGSGGAGVITAGTMLLQAAGVAGHYAYMTRSAGAQIRGGEATATIRFSTQPILCQDDNAHILVGIDWQNLGKYAREMALSPASIIVTDPAQGAVPEQILASGAQSYEISLKKLARSIEGGRPNMLAVGIVARLIGLPYESVEAVLEKFIGHKGEKVMASSRNAVLRGMELAAELPEQFALPQACGDGAAVPASGRWSISGNEAAGLGAIRGGIRYAAAYPITPATDMLEYLAPALDKIGGALVQVEDELASINHIIGASYGGVPSITATSGPGLALMTESIGLAIASETPVVVVDVMRGGPSTGIPTKAEQSDLNIALYGMHGDAPHLVLAPNSVTDCIFTTHWAVHLAETLQTVAIVLSDQSLGQAQAIVDTPPQHQFDTRRLLATEPPEQGKYQRYAITESGVSPMAVPGVKGCQYTADGLEHTQTGLPSSMESDHVAQMDKRLRKLTSFDYGAHWADIEGEGDVAVITWGSCTGAIREALARLREQGRAIRLISIRLLFPVQPEQFHAALAGVKKAVIIEQTHSGQFSRYLRSYYDLPRGTTIYCRPGPLTMRPAEICQQLRVGK